MRRYTLEVGGKPYVIDVQEVTADRYRVEVEGQEYEVRLSGDEDLTEARISPEIVLAREAAQHLPQTAPAARPATPFPASSSPPSSPRPSTDGHIVGALTAPMPGKILSVEVKQGDRVSRGQTVVILEAMKMKNAIKSPYDGVVLEIMVRAEQTVAYGDPLAQLGEE
ncbi:MAG: biotin/lipoyl-binding protein [candidate division NC10 bacterium]|nr:biotin/lipoyl-binding protein [candidate division NC10 bacterium]